MIRQFLHKLFIPNEGNDYAPHSLQKAAVVGMMLMIVISFALANLQALLWISSDWMVSTILPAVIVADTNEERIAASLTPLSQNEVLDKAAQLKADDMASKGYFSHYSPDGVSPWYWFNEASYDYVNAGENLAVHFTDSDKVVKAWMNSPAHRDNIMNGSYREIGIGTAKGFYQGYDTVFVVQLFGSQAASESTVSLTPEASVISLDEVADNNSVAVLDEEALVNETAPVVAGASQPALLHDDKSATSASGKSDTEVLSAEDVQSDGNSTTEPLLAKSETGVELTEDGTVVYMSFTSTSTGGIPASLDSTVSDTGNGGTTAQIFSFFTKPHLMLQVLYSIIGTFVVVALILSIVIEVRRQQPLQIVYGTGLLTVMFLLFYIHVSVSSGVLII